MRVPAKSTLTVIDRRLYVSITIAAILLVFIGFARSFYLKPLFETPPISNLLLLHGVIMTLWFILFVVQMRLVATGRTHLHRQTGKIGAVLFVLILAVGTAAAIASARRGVSPVPGITSIDSWLYPWSPYWYLLSSSALPYGNADRVMCTNA